MRLLARPYAAEEDQPVRQARTAVSRVAAPRGRTRRLAVRRLAALFLAGLAPAALLPAALQRPVSWAGSQAWAAGIKLEDYEAGPYALGGDFSLTDQQGRQWSLKDFRGRVVLIFFGYTYCPDVCPLTLTEMGRLRKQLGADAGRVQPVFITVDPARDTPQRLKSYLANFDAGIVGLTGPESEIGAVAARYQARFTRSSAKTHSGYLVDHTAFVYMLDGQGKVRYLFTYDAGADLLAQGVRRLLKG